MDKNPMQKVRESLYYRLSNFDFSEDQLRDKSVFQLVNLVYLFAGLLNYLGCFTTTCRTMEELFGTDGFYVRTDKPENLVVDSEPKPKTVVN